MPVAPHDAARRVADLDDVVVVLLVRDDRVPARREECVVVEVEARLSRPARVAPQDVAGRIDHEHAVVPAVGDEEVAGQRAAEPARQPAVAACRMRTAHRPAGRRDREHRPRGPGPIAPADHEQPSGQAGHAGIRERAWKRCRAMDVSAGADSEHRRHGHAAGADPADDVHAAVERAGRRMHQRLGQRPDPRHGAVRRREPVDRAARPRLGPAAGDQDGVPQGRHRCVAEPDRKPGDPAGMPAVDRDDPVRPRRAGEAADGERGPTHRRDREVGERRRQPADDPHAPGRRVERGDARVARDLTAAEDDEAPPPARGSRSVVDREREAPGRRHGRAVDDRDRGRRGAARIKAAERVRAVADDRDRGVLDGGRELRDLANANPRRPGAGRHRLRPEGRCRARGGRMGRGCRR